LNELRLLRMHSAHRY